MKTTLFTIALLVFGIGQVNAQFAFKNLSNESANSINQIKGIGEGKKSDIFLFPAFLPNNKEQSRLAI